LRVLFGSYPDLLAGKGGLQTQVFRTAAELRKQGSTVHILGVDDVLDTYDVYHHFSIVPAGFDTFHLGKSVANRVVLSPVYNISNQSLFRRVVRTLSGYTPSDPLGFRKQTAMVSEATRLVFLGELEQQKVLSLWPVYSKKSDFVPNGIDLTPTPPVPKKNYLLQVGNIYRLKNQAASIEAAAVLDLPLKIVGESRDPNYQRYCERLAKKKRCDVDFVGWVDSGTSRFAEIVAQARLLLLPSSSEVLPLSVLEALALGTHAVVTSNSNLPSYASCLDGVSFVDVSKRGVNNLVRCIRKELQKSPARLSLPPCFESTFSWESVANRLSRVYSEESAENVST
jgi:glycosyltransferase involved in cell wall biosynthesis